LDINLHLRVKQGLTALKLLRHIKLKELMEDQHERIRDITQFNGILFAVSDGGILFRISKK